LHDHTARHHADAIDTHITPYLVYDTKVFVISIVWFSLIDFLIIALVCCVRRVTSGYRFIINDNSHIVFFHCECKHNKITYIKSVCICAVNEQVNLLDSQVSLEWISKKKSGEKCPRHSKCFELTTSPKIYIGKLFKSQNENIFSMCLTKYDNYLVILFIVPYLIRDKLR